MYTLDEIRFMQTQAKNLQLKYPEVFLTMPPEELNDLINGYGPERWPETIRQIISWFFRHYPTPAAIHDVRYSTADGMEPTRKAADAEFAANLHLVWKNRYGWLRFINPLAIYDAVKLRAASTLTSQFGRHAWQESYQRQCSGKSIIKVTQ